VEAAVEAAAEVAAEAAVEAAAEAAAMKLSLWSSQYKGSEGMTRPLSSYIWYMTERRIKRQEKGSKVIKEG